MVCVAVHRLRIAARSAGEPTAWCWRGAVAGWRASLVSSDGMLRVFCFRVYCGVYFFLSPPMRTLFTLFSLPSFVLYIPRHAIFYTFLNLGTLLLFSLANPPRARDKPGTMRSVSLRVTTTRGTCVAHVDHAKGLVLPPGAAEPRRTPPSQVSCTWLVSSASRGPNVDRGT